MNNIIVLLTQSVPEGRVFGLDMQTWIQAGVQLFNAILLAVVLTYILYKPVKAFMQKRSDGIRGDIDRADETMTKATSLIEEYEAKLERIDQEQREILERARHEAEEQKKQILAEARTEANKIKQQSMETLARDKERLQEEMRLYVIDLSMLMATKYVSDNMDEASRTRYFEKMMDEMEESTWPS